MSSKKQQANIAHRLSKNIQQSRLTLAHAFVLIRRDGFKIRVAKINGSAVVPEAKEAAQDRINVEVVNGIVRRCWVG